MPEADGGQPEQRAGKRTVPAVVAVGVFMATPDTSVVNIGLTAVARATSTACWARPSTGCREEA